MSLPSPLYIITPPVAEAKEIFTALDLLTRTVPVSVVRLCLAPGFGPHLVSDLRGIVQNRDVALLIEDDIEYAARSGADGVHLTNHLNVRYARERLGKDASIGAYCYASRHAAMEAGEQGADYVAFGPGRAPEVAELTAWWSELSTLPVVIEGATDEVSARRVMEAGADFLAFPLEGADPASFAWLVNRPL